MEASQAADVAVKQKEPRRNAAIPLSAGMLLVTLGVVYGDIGTSPMYTLKAIMSGNGGLLTMETDVVLGALSLIIWTMTLITTVKYVLIAMKADNNNEGGIFALYSLVKHCGPVLIIPAMIGGAALLADGILTPAVTVTTAIEGLRTIPFFSNVLGTGQGMVIAITVLILCILFAIQRAGTSSIGKLFGPIMLVWFGFLAIEGISGIILTPEVFRALNPVRGIMFLFSGNLNKAGLMVLGNVFLCTTGAEALYSDMGHVGKANVYASWPVVKACLIINYLGQGAWILANNTNPTLAAVPDLNPFFEMLPSQLRIVAVVLSTLAAIIASQALITGSYSIISEAIRLDLMPHMRIVYPSEQKGQLYIPLVNNIMWVGCIGVVLLFRTSSHMEAAYGLAITVTMLMTTVLLFVYLAKVQNKPYLAVPFLIFFMLIEGTFFFASLTKFFHGGYVTVFMALAIFLVMYIWRKGTAIERAQSVYLPTREYLDQIFDLSYDQEVPRLADNLVFLTNDASHDMLDRDILYSILDKQPKRARAYWFLNVLVTDEPYTREFTVESFGTDFVFKVQLRLGFRVNQCVNEYLYQVVDEMVRTGRIAPQRHPYSIYRNRGDVGDFRFCLIRKVPGSTSQLTATDRNVLLAKYAIRSFCGSPANWYGLETSSIIFEYVPLFVRTRQTDRLTYVELGNADATYVRVEDEDDIFESRMRDERMAGAETARNSLIGGNTAQFAPVRVEEE